MTPLMCLAAAIFFEARDQPIIGQIAVAEVVMNRVEHEKFPDTVCAVVYDGKAFSFTHDGLSDDIDRYIDTSEHDSRALALYLADLILNDDRVLNTPATHYHATYKNPNWSKASWFYPVGQVQDHIFYRCEGFC